MIVTVIIPVLNRPALLHRALATVSEQSAPPLEILVIDDGSHPPLNPSNYSQYPNLNFLEMRLRKVLQLPETRASSKLRVNGSHFWTQMTNGNRVS